MILAYFQLQIGKDIGVKLQTSPSVQMSFKGAEKKLRPGGIRPLYKLLQKLDSLKTNQGSAGIDQMSWEDLNKDLSSQLYKLWNRLTSGSYFPLPVKQVEIPRKEASF